MNKIEIRKILAPVDFSDPSSRALDYAAAIARQLGAEVILVHVAEPPPFSPDLTQSHGYEDRVTAYAEKNLAELVKQHVDQGVKTRYVTRFGKAYEEIVAAAEAESADLIVMATQGHSGLTHLLIGSTTERVVRSSPIPVLSLKDSP